MEDLLAMQRCNLLCLPENYQLKVRHGPTPADRHRSIQHIVRATMYVALSLD
jgi:hypothetical protein